jgi:4-hydroxy-4-methyl-2-oxoglutarate aldolase
MARVMTGLDRTDASLAAAFAELGVATVHEAQGRTGLLSSRLLPRQTGAAISGTALTCEVPPGDNWMIHVALEQARPGDILIVSPTSPCDDGYFGDLLATSALALGVRGLVIDAGVRDTSELREMGFPVWSRHVSCQGTVKSTAGSVNVSVVLGALVVNPGDVVCADDDGVVVVPRAEAEWALAQSEARIAKEHETRARLARGELGVDFYGLRAKLHELGVEYVDRLSGGTP